MGRILTFISGKDALKALAKQTEVFEKTSSVFWQTELSDFNVSLDGQVDGSAALGNSSAEVSAFKKFAHSFMQ